MTTKELMKVFGISERTVRRWIKLGCPYDKDDSGLLVFSIEAVSDWKLKRAVAVSKLNRIRGEKLPFEE